MRLSWNINSTMLSQRHIVWLRPLTKVWIYKSVGLYVSVSPPAAPGRLPEVFTAFRYAATEAYREWQQLSS